MHTERQFTKFTVVKAIMVSNQYQFSVGDIGAKVERGVLRRKPFRNFGIGKKENVLDALFMDRIKRKVQCRDNRVITKRKSHDLETVLVEHRRLAGIIA